MVKDKLNNNKKVKKDYLIVDEENRIIDSFSYQITALSWLRSYKKLFGTKCKIIRKKDFIDDKNDMSLLSDTL